MSGEDFDVVAYLASKGLQGRKASGAEVVYPCFMDCGEASDSRKRKLYINTDTGFFECKVCGQKGGTYLLQRHFGDEPIRDERMEHVVTRREILGKAAIIGSTFLENNDDVLLYLMNERGLDVETILDRRLGFVGSGWSLIGSIGDYKLDELEGTGLVVKEGLRKGRDFFWRHMLIPYIRNGEVIQLRGRIWGESHGAKYMTGPGESVYLYGQDDLKGASEVIITEGEFDAMVLKQHLQRSPDTRVRNIRVVGLAGTGAFPDGFESMFDGIKKVFIGFDSDAAGRKAAEKVEEKLKAVKPRRISLPVNDETNPKDGTDWSDYLLPIPQDATSEWKLGHPYAGHTWSDVVGLLAAASGKRIFSVAESGAAYRAYREDHDGLKTGYIEVDATIRPGLLPGQLWVILAKTGAGKTVLLCNLAINMRTHYQLIVSLEMTREEVYDRLRRQYLFWNPEATDAELEFALSKIYICDENRMTSEGLEAVIDEYEEEVGRKPEVVQIDYLGYFARGAKGNGQYEKVTNAVMELKAIAKKYRCVVISPSQVNRLAKQGKPIDLDDARDSGAIEETADFLFALFRPDEAMDENKPQITGMQEKPTGRVSLSVLKSRHGGVGKVFGLQMDMLTLAMVDGQSPAAKVAREHNELVWRGYTWDDLRREQTRPRQLDIHGRVR